ncbi:MAG: phosphotransferase [Alphaproteobacteria bacterium]|nr:phosphotransferase [Alphaproteobacteria bacterium]
MENRKDIIQEFLNQQKWGDAHRLPLAGDASFRRYERLIQNNKTVILMDAPPPKENIKSFLNIGKILNDIKLSAPEIYAYDELNGLILLEDLGDNTYTVLLQKGYSEKELYELAGDVLIEIRQRIQSDHLNLIPKFDVSRALREVQVFLDWYWPLVMEGAEISEDIRKDYVQKWERILHHYLDFFPTLTLFDFHVDNLILLPQRIGVRACGLLDFQDAVSAPAPFDLMSLIDDARRDVSLTLGKHLKDRYKTNFSKDDYEHFDILYDLLAAQRHTRILGTFCRLYRRDHKPAYLNFIPRVWQQLMNALQNKHLLNIKEWFDYYIPSSKRLLPPSLLYKK